MSRWEGIRWRCVLRGILITAGIVSFLLAVAAVFLFGVNRFELEVQPIGSGEILVDYGTNYIDAGARVLLRGSLICQEGIVLDIPVKRDGEVDLGIPESYTVRYEAEYHHWKASGQRIVYVQDLEPPEITLRSIPGSYTIPGEPYREEGVSAWDRCDGDLTDAVTSYEQDGFVHYSVTDRAGNTTCVSRKLRYVDPLPPEITLNGGETFQMDAGTPFADPGWTVLDNADGDLSDRVQVEGSVDIYLAGSYELTYRVTDHSGNEAVAKRTVIVVPKPYAETVTPSGNVIYLTFDDGPCVYTEYLLEILDRYGAKATFFVVNTESIGLVKEMVDRGHAVGIHSVTHDYGEIYASPEAFFADLLTMQDIIYQHCGVKTYLMRFPGGSSNTVSRFTPGIMTYLTQAVEDMGFRYFDWNVDSNDAGGARTSKVVFENVKNGAMSHRISIVLQHDIKDFSVEAVEKILAWGVANGYRFLPLGMDSPTAHHGVNN